MQTSKFEKTMTWIIGVLMGVLFLAPFYLVLVNSIKTQKGIYLDVLKFPTSETLSLVNYQEAFKQLNFISSFKNSLLISVSALVVLVIFGSMCAWALVRTKNKLSTVIFLVLAGAMLVPFQSVMLPLMRIAGKLNLLNPTGLVFMYLGFGAPLTVILYHGFIKGIPYEIEEASIIDGCNPPQTFFRVVLPLLKPITVTVMVLNVMWTWNDFLLPQLVINRPEWQTIPLKMFYFFGQYSKRWDLALAGLVISMLPIVIFYLCMQKYIIKGVTQGAVK